jgi:hypothetical protein
MKKFITIILRNQFNLFYRFGYTYIPNAYVLEFEELESEKTKEELTKLFSQITPFEYDEEYLILQLEKELDRSNEVHAFNIQELVAVYPLSQQAKISIESKFDPRIKLEEPIFEELLPNIEIGMERNEIEKAINALWHICGIDGDLNTYLANIGMENISKGLDDRKKGIKANKIEDGNYWEYLIAYDRYDYFPDSTLGYFYDAGQVFAYSKGRETFEGSKLHTFLEQKNKENSEMLIKDILMCFETEEQLKQYISQTTTENMRQYIVAPLYFKLRDEIRTSDDITQTTLFKHLAFLKDFGDDFKYAITLLGAFFGFRKFYDAYYDRLNLRFYKNYKETIDKEKVPENVEKPAVENVDTITDNERIKGIICEQLQKQPIDSDVKITELAKSIKDITRKTMNNGDIKDIIQNMEDIESYKKGNTDMVRKKIKKTENSLFPPICTHY